MSAKNGATFSALAAQPFANGSGLWMLIPAESMPAARQARIISSGVFFPSQKTLCAWRFCIPFPPSFSLPFKGEAPCRDPNAVNTTSSS